MDLLIDISQNTNKNGKLNIIPVYALYLTHSKDEITIVKNISIEGVKYKFNGDTFKPTKMY